MLPRTYSFDTRQLHIYNIIRDAGCVSDEYVHVSDRAGRSCLGNPCVPNNIEFAGVFLLVDVEGAVLDALMLEVGTTGCYTHA